VNFNVDGLEGFEHVEGDAESLHGLDGVPVSEGDPEEARLVENFCGVVEQELLVPVGVAAGLDQNGHYFCIFIRFSLLIQRPSKLTIRRWQSPRTCPIQRKIQSSPQINPHSPLIIRVLSRQQVHLRRRLLRPRQLLPIQTLILAHIISHDLQGNTESPNRLLDPVLLSAKREQLADPEAVNIRQLGQDGADLQGAVAQEVRFSLVFVVCCVLSAVGDDEGCEVEAGVAQNLLCGDGQIELVGGEDGVCDAGGDVGTSLLGFSV